MCHRTLIVNSGARTVCRVRDEFSLWIFCTCFSRDLTGGAPKILGSETRTVCHVYEECSLWIFCRCFSWDLSCYMPKILRPRTCTMCKCLLWFFCTYFSWDLSSGCEKTGPSYHIITIFGNCIVVPYLVTHVFWALRTRGAFECCCPIWFGEYKAFAHKSLHGVRSQELLQRTLQGLS